MKIKIKSREEIEKTLERGIGYYCRTDVGQYIGTDMTMRKEMLQFCGKEVVVTSVITDGSDRVRAVNWCWHPDWYEVIEDFSEEDLMDIELMDEMLGYFLEEI